MQRKIKLIKFIFVILFLWFSSHTLYVIIDGLKDKNQVADVAIVLGNKINADGIPSERLKQRLDHSIKLYNQKRINTIIVSGGFGKEGFWEGDIMKEYLINHNVPEEIIIVDNYGNDTEKTVENSIIIMDSLHYNSAISVSQYFHQTRIKKLFKKNGFMNIESSSPKYFECRDSYSMLREFIAYYKEAI